MAHRSCNAHDTRSDRLRDVVSAVFTATSADACAAASTASFAVLAASAISACAVTAATLAQRLSQGARRALCALHTSASALRAAARQALRCATPARPKAPTPMKNPRAHASAVAAAFAKRRHAVRCAALSPGCAAISAVLATPKLSCASPSRANTNLAAHATSKLSC